MNEFDLGEKNEKIKAGKNASASQIVRDTEKENLNQEENTKALEENKKKKSLLVAIPVLGILASLATLAWGVITVSQLNERAEESRENFKKILDVRVSEYLRSEVVHQLGEHYLQKGTYRGFQLGEERHLENEYCKSEIIIDISPDREDYIVHARQCQNPSFSSCYDSKTREIKTVATDVVEKTFQCQ